MLILIAGPYRSGTNDNQKLMQQNLNSLESVALLLFRKGHIPMIGEWVALLLIQDIGVLDMNIPASCADEWPVYLPLDGNVQIDK